MSQDENSRPNRILIILTDGEIANAGQVPYHKYRSWRQRDSSALTSAYIQVKAMVSTVQKQFPIPVYSFGIGNSVRMGNMPRNSRLP